MAPLEPGNSIIKPLKKLSAGFRAFGHGTLRSFALQVQAPSVASAGLRPVFIYAFSSRRLAAWRRQLLRAGDEYQTSSTAIPGLVKRAQLQVQGTTCDDFASKNGGLAATKAGDFCGQGAAEQCYCFAVRLQPAQARGKINVLRVLGKDAGAFAMKARAILALKEDIATASLPGAAVAPCRKLHDELRNELTKISEPLASFGLSSIIGGECGKKNLPSARCVCVALQADQDSELATIARVQLPAWRNFLALPGMAAPLPSQNEAFFQPLFGQRRSTVIQRVSSI